METLQELSSSVDAFLRPIDDAFAPLNVWFDNAALSAGRPPDQLKYIASLLACYPLALIFRFLPRSPVALRHLFSIAISWFLTTLCLGSFAFFHSFFSSLVTYLILTTLPRSVSHQVNFVWVFGYMSCAHIYRMYVDYMGWTLDFTTMQMVLTIKLTAIGLNYHDAHVFGKLSSAEKEKFTPVQKELLTRSISRLPNLLEFYGWVYSFTGFLAGPAFEYYEYRDFISRKMFQDEHCKGQEPGLGRVWMPSLYVLGKALATLPLIVLSGMYPVTYLVSAAYTAAPFYEKILRLVIHTSLGRSKYYFGFFLAEGSSILAGLGYNGAYPNGKLRFTRMQAMHFFAVELPLNVRAITSGWNTRTADWIRFYCYERCNMYPPKHFLHYSSTYVAMAMSAFWHGFYSGYYTFFLATAVLTNVARELRRIVRPFFCPDEKSRNLFYDILTTAVTMVFVNFTGSTFFLLDHKLGLQLWHSLYYFGLWLPALVLVLCHLPPLSRMGRRRPTTVVPKPEAKPTKAE